MASFVAANAESLTSAISLAAGDVSLGGWVYWDGSWASLEGFARISTADAYGGASTPLAIYGYGSNIVLESWNVEGAGSTVDAALPALRLGWNYIVVVADTSVSPQRLKYSINGNALTVLDQAASGTTIAVADRVMIGRVGTAANLYSNSKQGSWALWNTALADTEITSLFNSGVGKRYADLTAAEKVGLVSYWNLDETSDGSAPVTRVDSVVASGNNLTDNGTGAYVSGVVNSGGAMHNAAASFVAANAESLSIATGPDFGTGDLAISMWINQANGDVRGLVGSGDSLGAAANTLAFSIMLQNGTGAVVLFANAAGVLVNQEFNVASPFGEWVHLLVTRGGSSWIAYVNGSGSTAITVVPVASGDLRFAIGSVGWGGGYALPANGLIDEAAIWSRVLDVDERAALYAAGAGVYYPTFE